MGTSAVWMVVECACRILGVSTAAVMCAVGVETLRQGEFHSLAVYLLVSSAGMLVFELSFFTDILLMWCLPCPPKWKVFVLWKKLATLGGFQKFLYYTLMSVVCFLHPVLLWHAVIPGTMLLVTGFAYFLLSKKQNGSSAKEPAGAAGRYEDASTVTTVASDGGEAEQTYSFFRIAAGNRTSALSYFPGAGDKRASRDGAQATPEAQPAAEASEVPSGKRDKRRVCFNDKYAVGSETETKMQEYQDAEHEETTSDKAPMIRP
ncbi:transmembrane protein 72 [Anguilla anguilla]|uniref:transmembrane protein 72 n=1 Tax=Anguilla anguilla TaxID=7936 RepID=UPI0015ADD1AA|nr:transmembrane protein 72 [Anguilla anguilla]